MPTLPLRTEPSVRQTRAILSRIERELAERGAAVTRENVGALRFDMPRPWAAPKLGLLLAITSGRATLSAGAGERWRVRYELSYAVLRGLVIALTLVVVAAGWGWSRVTLLNTIIALWAALYGVPYALAGRQFRRIIAAAAHDVVERRTRERADAAGGAASGAASAAADGAGAE